MSSLVERGSQTVREVSEAELDRYVSWCVSAALEMIRTKHEEPKNPLDKLVYHVRDHTTTVMDRTDRFLVVIMDALEMPRDPRIRAIGKLAAGYHDVEQFCHKQTTPPGPRRRRDGYNESMSEKRERDLVPRLTDTPQGPLFSEQEFDMIGESIQVTFPTFKDGTVIQPRLTQKSSVVARAVALADLGAAGLDPEAFLTEGDEVFKESRPDIFYWLSMPVLDHEQRELFTQTMLSWTKGQIDFAIGRKKRLDSELTGLPAVAQEALRGELRHFDRSIELASERNEIRLNLAASRNPFEALIEDFKFVV